MPQEPTVGYLLSDDLMFTSRITGTARDLGLTVQPARSVAALEGLVQKQTPRCVLLDLANAGLVVADLVPRLKSQAGPPFIVAYGSHVDAPALKAAREAGCDLVLPRSKFVEELPRALAGWLGRPDGGA
jgi:CheY-like chemotaxis protein